MNTNLVVPAAGQPAPVKPGGNLALHTVLLNSLIVATCLLLADALLAARERDPVWLSQWHTGKDLVALAVATVLIYGILRRKFLPLQHAAAGRRQAEEERHRAEQQKSSLVDNIDGIVWEAEAETFHFTFVSRPAERLLGYPLRQWLEQKTFWEDHLHPEDREPTVKYCQEQMRRGAPHECEYRMIAADGRVVWLRDRVTVEMAQGRPVVLRGLMVDTTRQKKLEAEVFQREHQLNAFFTSAPAGLVLLDSQLRFIKINETVAQINGVSIPDHLGKTIREVLPKLAPAAEPLLHQVLATGKPLLNVKLSGETPDQPGVVRHWMESLFPMIGRDGQPDGVGVILVEITDHVQTVAELRRKTAFLEAKVDASLDGILVVDSQGQKVLQNQRFVDLWKIPPEIARDQHDSRQLKFVRSMTRNPEQFAAKVAHLYAHPDEVSQDEIELLDGTVLERYSSPVRDPAGNYFGRIWTFRDLTERRLLEAQLRQAQKMDAIGQLAGGVAHDFNNILALILLQAGQLRLDTCLTPEQVEAIRDIETAAQRAASLTRQLLLFSRKQTLQPLDQDLNETVAHLARMLERVLGEHIQMQCQFAPQPLPVNADPGMLDQILMNLTVNARDAMPAGGRLVVKTFAAHLDEVQAAQIPRGRPGSFVGLSVSDNGSGIPPENLPRIFEPFFTTKPVGQGTGLGLATVFGIVQQHQGWINVYSESGQGTTFEIYFPRQPGAAARPAEQALPDPLQHGHETLLLVEDEPSLRALVRTVLSRLGYHVLTAASGVEAREVWNRHRGQIHLLITDMVMPEGVSGPDLARTLRQKYPGLKVIFTSGYSVDLTREELQLEEGVNFLGKPFKPGHLAQTIRKCLDQ